MKMFLIAAAMSALTAIPISDAAMAQITGNGPWCIRIYTSSNQIQRCEYASFEQCQALNDGRNNTCFANPFVQQEPAPVSRRR